jgi:hypothetical protein
VGQIIRMYCSGATGLIFIGPRARGSAPVTISGSASSDIVAAGTSSPVKYWLRSFAREILSQCHAKGMNGDSPRNGPHLLRLMGPEDQARYGAVPDTAPAVPRLNPHPSPKAGTAERKEQASFANWLLLQNSKGRKMPFSWHATNACSKATPGTPDFWVGVNRHAMWIEFKRDYSCELSARTGGVSGLLRLPGDRVTPGLQRR